MIWASWRWGMVHMCIITLLIFSDYPKAQPFSASNKGPCVWGELLPLQCLTWMHSSYAHMLHFFFSHTGSLWSSMGNILFREATHPFLPHPFSGFVSFGFSWINLDSSRQMIHLAMNLRGTARWKDSSHAVRTHTVSVAASSTRISSCNQQNSDCL